ncbi:MAG: dihydroorotase [Flavobacteriales bacterium]
MSRIILRNAQIVNEGSRYFADLSIRGEIIESIDGQIDLPYDQEIDLNGNLLIPGCIDDQVHFREPGLTYKADIFSESRAAVAGGITSFMEMPNTVPNALTQTLLEDKYAIAAEKSIGNYSFFMGVSNDNYDEVMRTNSENVCGIKIFMGSSTGNMLVDNYNTLEHVFANAPTLIATHCEDETTIKNNLARAKESFGLDIPIEMHPLIRSEEACYLSSSFAVELAKKTGARLHVLHISTAKETGLFSNTLPLKEKKITAEACVHHLWFSDEDYASKGNLIKWNPAVKTSVDREMIWSAVLDNRIDVIATDHAPHTLEEKGQNYLNAPSGGPLVQHALLAMLEKSIQGVISIERIVEKMAHAPADLFRINNRGYIKEGYYADLVEINTGRKTQVNKNNVFYKCGWSPFEGITFNHEVSRTFVNGRLVYEGGKIIEGSNGKRLLFNRL